MSSPIARSVRRPDSSRASRTAGRRTWGSPSTGPPSCSQRSSLRWCSSTTRERSGSTAQADAVTCPGSSARSNARTPCASRKATSRSRIARSRSSNGRYPRTSSRSSLAGLNIRTGMFHPSPVSIPRARVADIATFAPAGRLTNADLAKMVETSDEWIVQRTGIRERSIADGNQFASDLCLEAVRRLRERVGSLERVDAVIAATSTADYVFPSLAAQVQYGANLPHAGAFDVGAACAGFPYAINIASALIASGQAREVLVVGGEVM